MYECSRYWTSVVCSIHRYHVTSFFLGAFVYDEKRRQKSPGQIREGFFVKKNEFARTFIHHCRFLDRWRLLWRQDRCQDFPGVFDWRGVRVRHKRFQYKSIPVSTYHQVSSWPHLPRLLRDSLCKGPDRRSEVQAPGKGGTVGRRNTRRHRNNRVPTGTIALKFEFPFDAACIYLRSMTASAPVSRTVGTRTISSSTSTQPRSQRKGQSW